MKTLGIAILVAAALVSTPTWTQAEAAPLAPVGNWNLEYAQDMCILSHGFGIGDAQVTLGFRPWPMGEKTEVVLLSRDSTSTASQYGKGTLSLSPVGPAIEGEYSSYWLPKRQIRLVTLTVEQAALAGLASARVVTVATPKSPPVNVTPPGNFKEALAALGKCDDDLLRGWGVDPAELTQIATPAAPIPGIADWVTQNDYPPEALRKGQQGSVMILWTIGADGRVSNCVPVLKSGVPTLDQAACDAISRHGRYRPALDKDGKPVPSHNTRRVVWRLPS